MVLAFVRGWLSVGSWLVIGCILVGSRSLLGRFVVDCQPPNHVQVHRLLQAPPTPEVPEQIHGNCVFWFSDTSVPGSRWLGRIRLKTKTQHNVFDLSERCIFITPVNRHLDLGHSVWLFSVWLLVVFDRWFLFGFCVFSR